MSTGGALVTSKRSASGSVNVTSTPSGIAAISIATGAWPRLYFTMLVNSSSSTKSTSASSAAGTPWRANAAVVNAKISASTSMRRANEARSLTGGPRAGRGRP